MNRDDVEFIARVVLVLGVLVMTALILKGCSPSRCTSHPYDPKAACADPRAQLGTVDAGQP